MSEIKDFELPDLGEGLEEAEIVEWHVDVGDVIELNQTVADVETAKAVVAVPSPFAGTVVERIGEVGESLTVGSVFLRIDIVRAPASTGLDADEEPQPLVGYGQGRSGPPRTRRRRGTSDPGQGEAGPGITAVSLAKPPVRKLAKDLGVDLVAISPGSGPDGVITRDDVQRAATSPPSSVEPPRPQAAGVAGGANAAVTAGEKTVPGFRGRMPGEVEPIRGIRKRIAEKMELSRREIPAARCSRDADLTELWEVRNTLTRMAHDEGFDVAITPFALVMRATALGLRRFPTLNASLDREAGEIHLLKPIHLGFAVDTDRGLVVPNIKDAHTLSTLQLALRLTELAGMARDGSVEPGVLAGGTFTVSNYGAFGNDDGDPIINHPEAAILGVGAIRERPWVVQGELAVRRVARFTLAFDHRICDGGEAGRFVTYVAQLCEQPAKLLLHV